MAMHGEEITGQVACRRKVKVRCSQACKQNDTKSRGAKPAIPVTTDSAHP